MADNVAITAGSGTTIAADDIGGVLTQRVKVQWGPDGTVNDADTASGKPLPVQLRSSTGTAAVVDSHGSQQSTLVDSSGNAITFNANGQAASAASAPVVIASDQSIISVVQDTTKIGGGVSGTLLTPLFANFAVSSSGDQEIVPLVGGKKIRVIAYSFNNIGGSSVTARWRSDTTGTPSNISGKKLMSAAGSGYVQGFNVVGWFETASGKNLGLNLSGANEVSGEVVYVTV